MAVATASPPVETRQAAVPTEVANFSRHARKAIVRRKDRAADAALPWVNPPDSPTNRVHHVRLPVNLTRCAPASI
jgi:hypothetical protein